MKNANYLSLFVLLWVLAILAACSNSDSNQYNAPVPTTSLSGVVFAGPASGAVITVKTPAGVVVATSNIATDVAGAFTVAVPTSALSGDLIFETSGSGATFTDEATSASAALGTLSAFVPGGSLGSTSSITLDPSSTIIQKLIAGGKTKAAAFSAYSSTFGYKPDFSVKPVFANTSTAASVSRRLAGFRAAAFSQLTKDLKDPAVSSGIGGAAKQFELLQAIADDLADGTLDGKKNGVAVKTVSNFTIPDDILNQYNAALITYQKSDINKSKLAVAQINAPVSGTVSLTPSYRVEYVTPTGGDVVSADTIQLKITKRSDGSAATGLASSIVFNPYMVMSSMSSGANWPHVVTETATPGVYSGVVRYSMETYPGLDMYWKLYVIIGAETAYFYPKVSPLNNMDTVTASFYNNNDLTSGTTKRRYRIWREGLNREAAGTYSFAVFVSSSDGSSTYGAINSANNYPVYAGEAWSAAPFAINSVKVQAYDGTAWVDMVPIGVNTGKYAVTGLPLVAGIQGNVSVRLLINGITYTNANTGIAWDNSAATTSNAVQTFKVTP